ncbi:Arginine/ornithine antiporter, putative [Perkinsus marinus ATCC 50983]|uniref:Arginine/ornithine antiporter, putative n=1 Tax=Perkinsus marinus (strain ATCC 50983 / TXsc) TaxID=423536 RepID=C5L4H5_PERM5|nr:Arginine/ornithine antiporter, putative [Perkinsus marinus ATCC 50983]EER08412.1 Arginine/ornithine antiporter, putative [Perkinsus marinus ATCC 50983]|eukprot:XP_002776596.1 Arginine/ornithine antiporter, putative [Perkinsus marinus ATCC 50983]
MIKPQGRKKPLTLWGAVAIIFYSVSGGPFGTEDAVAAGGPFWALLGFLIFPFVWCLPEALVTAEMSSTFPSNCGYVSWVTAAFGPYWGFQEGFWSWLSGATDNAIYPHLLMTYLAVAFPILNERVYNIVLVILTLSLSYVNYRGLKVVGWLAVAMMCFVLSPFIVFIVMGVPQVEPSNWLLGRNDMEWTKWLNVLFWNLNYWDSVSTLAGEVENARSAMPKALLLALCVTCLAYILPLAIATGVDGSFALKGDQAFDAWQAGFLGKVAYDVGGWALGGWVVLAAAVSNIGQYHAEMSSDSYQIQAMAEHGWLPEKLAYRNHYETPTFAICLQLVVILSLTTLDFLDIVELLNCIYCLAELLEFAAFLYLRYTNPDIWRPYTIPLGFWGCVILLLPPSVFICFILGAPVVNADWGLVGFTLGAVVIGNVL